MNGGCAARQAALGAGGRPSGWVVQRVLVQAVVLTLVSGALLTFRLGTKDFWGDEIASLQLASPSSGAIPETVATHDIHPPLFFLVLGLWTRLVDDRDVAAVRLLPAFFAVAAVLATYALGVKLSGTKVAFAAGLILATSPLLVLRGLMVRPFSMAACLSVISLFFGARALHSPRGRDWVMYVIATTLMLYTDYLLVSYVVVLNLIFALVPGKSRELWARWAAAQATVLLLLSPQLPTLGRQATSLESWIHPAYLAGSLLGAATKIAFPVYSFLFGETVYPWNLPVSGVGMLVGGVLYLLGVRRMTGGPDVARRAWLLVWTPILLLTVLTSTVFRGGSFAMFPGRLLFVLPVFVLTMANGLIAVRRPLLRVVLLAVVLAVHGYALRNYYAGEQFLNPNYVIPWRTIARDLEAAVSPGDVVVATSDGLAWNRGTLPLLHFGEAHTGALVRQAISARKPRRIWLQIRGGGDPTGYVLRPEFRHWLAEDYVVVSQRGYVPQPPEAVRWRGLVLGQEIGGFNVVVYEYARRGSAAGAAGGETTARRN